MRPDAVQVYLEEQKLGTARRLAGSIFSGATPDPSVWASTFIGSGTTGGGSGSITLSTGVTANSSSMLNTIRVGRTLFTNMTYFHGVVLLPAQTGTNVARWGAYNTQNGFFFQVSNGTFGVGSRKVASDTIVASGSFNGVGGPSYTLDTNFHEFCIYYNARGAYFFVDEVLIHSLMPTTTTLTVSQSLPVGLETTNSGGNTNNNSVTIQGATINRLGDYLTNPSYTNLAANSATPVVIKSSVGNLVGLVLNSSGASTNVLTLYDNTTNSGPVIATIATGGTGIAFPTFIDFKGLQFNTGLAVVLNGGASPANVTFLWE
jgi:hypothetical protein